MSASCVATNPNPVLILFNLHTHEAALARALRETNATIHGGSAVCWYTNTIPTVDQDIDIWCQPTPTMTEADIVARINAALTPAGYINRTPETSCICGGGEICELCLRAHYLQMGSNRFIAVHIWTRHLSHIVTHKIQLIIRHPHIPASPVADFDLDIATLCVAPHPEEDRLVMIEPDTELADRIRRHVMRIGNLRGQVFDNKKERVIKYYHRGYAFESPDGSRLTLEEAEEYIKKEWIIANPLPEDDPYRADNLRRKLEAQPITAETPDSILITVYEDYRNAFNKPQNYVSYSADLRWIKEYYDSSRFLMQTRRFIKSWDTASTTCISDHNWIRRFIQHYDAPYTALGFEITPARRVAFPSLCEQLDRVYSEALHILAGGAPDDRIRPAVPTPVKNVIKKE